MHAYSGGGKTRLGGLPYAYEGITPGDWANQYQPTCTTAEMRIWQIGTASNVTQVTDGVGDDRTGTDLNV